MTSRAFSRTRLSRVLAVVVAVCATTFATGSLPAAAVDAGPGEFAADVTTPDDGELDGELDLYQWDASAEEFLYWDNDSLFAEDGSDEYVATVPAGHYYATFNDYSGNYLDGYSGGATTAPEALTDPGVVQVTSEVGGNGDIALALLPGLVTVTGTVVQEGTEAPVEFAWVEADGPSSDETEADEDGVFSMQLSPGTYDFSVSASGYEDANQEVVVPEGGGDIGTIALTPEPPGITVRVSDATFGGGVEGADVTLQLASGGPVTTLTTDQDGTVKFLAVTPGDYLVDASHPDFEPSGGPVDVQYAGGVEYVDIDLEVDMQCDPVAANNGLTNMGFEDALNGWTLGYTQESIVATAADDFASPWEGSSMARLGNSQPDNSGDQEPGPNVLCQEFVVDSPRETFAFNAFTYDYTGYDEFHFDLTVVNPDTGETLAAYQQGAWGQGTGLKTSGWRGVELDLTGHVGETVTLAFRSGGTSDDLYAFWTYLDSADASMPPTVATSVEAATTETGSVMIDPVTGQMTVAYPSANPSALSLTLTPSCPDPEQAPESVSVSLNGSFTEATLQSPGVYSVTIPVDEITEGPLTMHVECASEPTTTLPLGEIVLYDPSGYITDSKTGQPIVGASVQLYKVPGWEPRGATGPYPADSCETNLSKAAGAPWSQPAPTHLGELVNAASPEIDPNVNPFLTDSEGHYGWDVAQGCWYVVVNAVGYQPLTSPVVGVPTEVTDLDLKLSAVPTQACLAAKAAVGPAQAAVAPAQTALNNAKASLTTAQAALTKAEAALKKAKAKLKKAKESGDADKIKKAKAKAKKAKAKVKTAKADVGTTQAAVGTATTALNQANANLTAAQAAVTKECG